MKTRLFIIIGIIVILTISGIFYSVIKWQSTDHFSIYDEPPNDDEKLNVWCAETFDLLYLNYIENLSIACEDSKDIQCQNEKFDDFTLRNKDAIDFRSSCAYNLEDWTSFSDSPDLVLEHMGPKFKIVGLDSTVRPNDPLFVSIEKFGYHMCDQWEARIIDISDNSLVWERDYFTTCIVAEPPKKQKFEYTVSNGLRPIRISDIGDYQFQITIGDTYLEEDFIVRLNTSGASLDGTG
jgi:hypothetical protein